MLHRTRSNIFAKQRRISCCGNWRRLSPRRRWRVVPGKASGVPRRWCTGRVLWTSRTRWRPTPWLGELGFCLFSLGWWNGEKEVIWSDAKWNKNDGGEETDFHKISKGHRCMCSCSSLAKCSGIHGEWLWLCVCGYRWPHSGLECLWRCTDACDPFQLISTDAWKKDWKANILEFISWFS